jgi:hypothetical protein
MSARYQLRTQPSAIRAKDGPVSRLGDPVLSKKHHISSDLSDPEETPVPAVAKDQADVSPLPTASAVGVPGLSWEPGVSHPLDGVLDRQSDPLASSVNPDEPELSTMPDDENSSSSSENNPSQHKARPVNHKRPDALSQEQAELVDVAWEAMTPAQRNLVDHRNKTVQHGIWFNDTPVSRGEGPSHGKGVDPCNWGVAGIPDEELDLDAQRNMLQDWEARHWIEEDRLARREPELLDRDAEHDAGAMNDEASKRNAESTDESNSESEMDVEVRALLKECIN